MHETRPSVGAKWVMVPCEPDMISLKATEVMLLNMLYMVCGLYFTIQTIRHHKNLYMLP